RRGVWPTRRQPGVSATSRMMASVRAGARIDRSQSSGWVALRNTIGVVVPLAVAVLTGAPASAGLACAIGALQTSVADRPGPYRLRLLRMVGTAFATAVTTTLAVVASRSDAWSVVLLFVLAFVAGLLLAGGTSATLVGVAAMATALILGHIPQPPGNA